MQAKSKTYGMRCTPVHMTPLGSVNVADHIKTTSGEPPVSRWAQTLGFGYGQDARRANNFNQPNIYNAYR